MTASLIEFNQDNNYQNKLFILKISIQSRKQN